MTDSKGPFVVLFTSANFVFFKHKNDKGVYAHRSIFNSSRTINKDDIYELVIEPLTKSHRSKYNDLPDAAVYVATKAKFVKTPRQISGVGTMKKISADGEYGFITYIHEGKEIQAFVTRITVKPALDKGGMLKFFSVGSKVRFVAREQPPSGMNSITWRAAIATDITHSINEVTLDVTKLAPMSIPTTPKLTSTPTPVPVAVQSTPVPVPATSSLPRAGSIFAPTVVPAPLVSQPIAVQPPPIDMWNSTGPRDSNSSSSSSSSVSNCGISTLSNGGTYASRAATAIPASVADVIERSGKTSLFNAPPGLDDLLPRHCPDPFIFGLSHEEKERANSYNFHLIKNGSPPVFSDFWMNYKREDERSLESFEAELSQLSRVAHALYGGDSQGCLLFSSVSS